MLAIFFWFWIIYRPYKFISSPDSKTTPSPFEASHLLTHLYLKRNEARLTSIILLHNSFIYIIGQERRKMPRATKNGFVDDTDCSSQNSDISTTMKCVPFEEPDASFFSVWEDDAESSLNLAKNTNTCTKDYKKCLCATPLIFNNEEWGHACFLSVL